MNLEWIFIFWLFLCFVTAVIAKKKGRSGVVFFFGSLFFSPLVGIIAALVATPDTKKIEKEQILSGDMKRCPSCVVRFSFVFADMAACLSQVLRPLSTPSGELQNIPFLTELELFFVVYLQGCRANGATIAATKSAANNPARLAARSTPCVPVFGDNH